MSVGQFGVFSYTDVTNTNYRFIEELPTLMYNE